MGRNMDFTSQGGSIQHEGAGQNTSLFRDCYIYRMDVQPFDPKTTGFTWLGK